MRFGIVADDYTGASDAAGMLVEKGVPTLLLFDFSRDFSAARDFSAVVIGTRIRSLVPKAAYRETARLFAKLKKLGVRKFQLKYCSTFDSTREGNIGPSLDAALESLRVSRTIVCPALPVNGRTTYCGYHFVKDQLLSESPMKDHPLTPMTDANLVRWLGYQTRKTVASVNLREVRSANLCATLDGHDAAYLVTDAVLQADCRAIAEATRDWPLISGGSGISAEMPDLFHKRRKPFTRKRPKGPLLVIAGSCSAATRAQNAYARAKGFTVLQLPGGDIIAGKKFGADLVARAIADLCHGKNVLVYSSADPSEVQRVQSRGHRLGLDAVAIGEKIAGALAEIAARIVEEKVVSNLVVSGGETSGTVVKRLGFDALEVGLPIEPGVPRCHPLADPSSSIVLKSGNFGSEDFYLRC